MFVQQAKLQIHTAKWDPKVRVVNVRIEPLSYETGVPLDQSEDYNNTCDKETTDDDYEELVVLPMDQFGRTDIRIPSAVVEELAEELSVEKLSPLNTQDMFGSPTADVLVGQQLYLRRFLPPTENQKVVHCGKSLAFVNTGTCGSFITGKLGDGSYREYSTSRIIWLYLISKYKITG